MHSKKGADRAVICPEPSTVDEVRVLCVQRFLVNV